MEEFSLESSMAVFVKFPKNRSTFKKKKFFRATNRIPENIYNDLLGDWYHAFPCIISFNPLQKTQILLCPYEAIITISNSLLTNTIIILIFIHDEIEVQRG